MMERMAGKFVVRKSSAGRFRFDLIGTNGRVLATSHTYESRAAALRAIESVRRQAAKAEIVDRSGTRVVGAGRDRRAPKVAKVAKVA
jgi:uncharacterized protein YegP (UPF0339 family)